MALPEVPLRAPERDTTYTAPDGTPYISNGDGIASVAYHHVEHLLATGWRFITQRDPRTDQSDTIPHGNPTPNPAPDPTDNHRDDGPASEVANQPNIPVVDAEPGGGIDPATLPADVPDRATPEA